MRKISNRTRALSSSPGVGSGEGEQAQLKLKVKEDERCSRVVGALNFAAPVRSGAPTPPWVLTGGGRRREEKEAVAAVGSSISEREAVANASGF